MSRVSLRIAFDLDGVLADMESELVRQAEILFGEAMTRRLRQAAETGEAVTENGAPGPSLVDSADGSDGADASAATVSLLETAPESAGPLLKLQMTARQQRKLWRHVEAIPDFWQSLKEIEPGSIERLAAIAAERRWELIFLTKRPETAGATSQLQTQRWLEARGFALPSVYVVQGSRGRIAAALGLDIVVDDRPENCLDVVVDSKARAILVWRDDESCCRSPRGVWASASSSRWASAWTS